MIKKSRKCAIFQNVQIGKNEKKEKKERTILDKRTSFFIHIAYPTLVPFHIQDSMKFRGSDFGDVLDACIENFPLDNGNVVLTQSLALLEGLNLQLESSNYELEVWHQQKRVLISASPTSQVLTSSAIWTNYLARILDKSLVSKGYLVICLKFW